MRIAPSCLLHAQAISNERPIGRVILPLPRLCAGSPLPRPTGARRLLLRVMPCSPQHSSATLARYTEATPHVPGSGMLRPSAEIGTVELLVHLRLEGCGPFGLLGAYARASPPGALEEAAESGGGGGGGGGSAAATPEDASVEKLQPKLLKLHQLRVRRCVVGPPPLLAGRWRLAAAAALYASCYVLASHHMPWLLLGLASLNGALDGLARRRWLGEAIYWEEEVGESAVPTGPLKKLRALAGALEKIQRFLGRLADVLERRRNLLNWTDPTVTFVALACLTALAAAASATLYLVPARHLCFAVGITALARPHLKPSGSGSIAAPSPPSTRLSLLRMVSNVLGRVPTGKDLAHRHFCEEQVLADESVDASLLAAHEEEASFAEGAEPAVTPEAKKDR